MTNKDKFLTLLSDEKPDSLERNKERIKNRAMLRESQQIAIKVLMRLDELGWSQKKLATLMEVSAQQINKIVSGKENLTLKTQIKLQTILAIPVLASYYENKAEKVENILQFKDQTAAFMPETNIIPTDYTRSANRPAIARINYDKASREYTYKVA